MFCEGSLFICLKFQVYSNKYVLWKKKNRYYEIVQYFLENGLSIQDDNFKDCLLTLCRISKFTLFDLPFELMDLLLLYGADPNYCEQLNFKFFFIWRFKIKFDFFHDRTPLHIACKHGMMQFAVSLITKGNAEVNPVDKNKKTPLNYVQEQIKKGKKFQELYDFLESKGGQLDWRKWWNKIRDFFEYILVRDLCYSLNLFRFHKHDFLKLMHLDEFLFFLV